MQRINKFESSVYSEELFPVAEAEYDEVMRLMASDPVIVSESENFVAFSDGTVRHRPEPPSSGRYWGIEI